MINKIKKPTGYIIYDGASLLDGKPIVVVALVGKSSNRKTGAMVQTYIIRSDIDPRLANKTGLDFSICGLCKHRGTPTNDPTKKLAVDRSCYIVIGQGPVIVYKGYKKGSYPKTNNIPELGKDRVVRLGTYGDPSAVPSYVWDQLLVNAKGSTGYSHQEQLEQSSFNPSYMMESADSLTQAQTAWANKRRTFRVIKDISEIDHDNEISCPASREAGQRTTCINCKLCSGSQIKAKSIAIVVHGAGKNKIV